MKPRLTLHYKIWSIYIIDEQYFIVPYFQYNSYFQIYNNPYSLSTITYGLKCLIN